jgi:hypothetical protein
MVYFTCNVGDTMGYFNNVSQETFDNEEKEYVLREKMIKVITKAYANKTYRDLSNLDYNRIRGLYAQACKVLKNAKENSEDINLEDDYAIYDENERGI